MRLLRIGGLLLLAAGALNVYAQTGVSLAYRVEASANASSGEYAPMWLTANRYGLSSVRANSGYLRAGLFYAQLLKRGWRVEAGLDLAGTLNHGADAGRAGFVVQQAYGDLSWRMLTLSIGSKERPGFPLEKDGRLSSGMLVEGPNARPVPQIRAGFVDFQNIPFTNGWVQIQGEIAYGKYMQNGWLEDHFNFYNGKYNLNEYFNYKRCYFRTKPSQPFSVTVGMQMVTEFGGTAYEYEKGKLKNVDPYDVTFKDVWKAFLPSEGGSNPGDAAYYYGNTLGSWDFVARYRLKDETELKAYFQWPFEDGSGIGKLNGFDGIWGLEYKSGDKNAIVSGAVVEYIDFTNQSGPMHWAPSNHPGTEYTDQATGGDNYYNNFRCNSYMNFGMSQGSPFIPATIYNRLGNGKVRDNRIRGFHVGVSGNAWAPLEYRLMFSYRKSWGTYSVPRLATIDDVSMMVEGIYSFKQVEGLSVKGQIAFDRGDLLGDNFGVLLSVNYKGLLNLFGK